MRPECDDEKIIYLSKYPEVVERMRKANIEKANRLFDGPTNAAKVAVFLTAIIIRGILFLNVINHPQVILQPDSRMYISLAKGLLEQGSLYSPDRPWHHDVDRMPGYP